jgi:putative flavoprotein involved in K+ transport
VVIAIGLDGRPVIPQSPDRGGFVGTLLHSAQYRSAEPFRDLDVLVVRSGCSGPEIAFDLLDGAA